MLFFDWIFRILGMCAAVGGFEIGVGWASLFTHCCALCFLVCTGPDTGYRTEAAFAVGRLGAFWARWSPEAVFRGAPTQHRQDGICWRVSQQKFYRNHRRNSAPRAAIGANCLGPPPDLTASIRPRLSLRAGLRITRIRHFVG